MEQFLDVSKVNFGALQGCFFRLFNRDASLDAAFLADVVASVVDVPSPFLLSRSSFESTLAAAGSSQPAASAAFDFLLSAAADPTGVGDMAIAETLSYLRSRQ
jgi:hypothetical protein